jgi:hypothetical protein
LFATVIGGVASADLTPASGRQDHTTSPSASGALVSSIVSVHRIPPRVRDDREPPPLWDETAMRDRTFLRPRDMIKFCNETLDAFKAAGEGATKFENKHILLAQAHYSDYLFWELEDEIHKQIPNYEFYVEVLKNLEALQFTRKDFHETWEKRKSLLSGDDNPDQAMKLLYDFSLIGYYTLGGGGGGAEYIWRYKNQKSTFNENASQFRVHSGFKEVLGLKKFVRSE